MEEIEEELDKLLDEEISKGKTFDMHDYITEEIIYTGNLSEILLVENKKTKEKYTIKSYQKKKIHQLYKEMELINEKNVMEKIQNHQNIVSYYGTAKDDFKIYFLYEYIKGEDLYKIVSNYGLKSEQLVKFYFIQILNAIKYLHSLSIPHRDIKPDNVIITSDGTKIKLIDFGSSCILNDLTNEKKYEEIIKKEKSQKKIFKYFIGTPGFIAPECIHNKFADTRSDYWSLGCLLYNLLTGFPPFLGENTFDKLEKASDGKFIYPNGILSEDAIDLINKLIVVDADKRLNIDQILSHPFLKKEYEDKNFLNKIPSVSKEDEEFYNIRINLVKKYEKVKKISEDLNMIKENENMDDEFKRNDEEMLNLIKNKDNLQKDYDNYLKNFTDEINKMKKDENEKNKLFNNRLNFLEIQIKNDLFNIK
jgi:3-phosphoinositide dependent protein kinase-1